MTSVTDRHVTQEACGTRTKLESLIEFPVTEHLDLSAFVDANNNHRCVALRTSLTDDHSEASTEQKENSCSETHAYDLYAVCRHSGSLQSGHYTGNRLLYACEWVVYKTLETLIYRELEMANAWIGLLFYYKVHPPVDGWEMNWSRPLYVCIGN